MKGNQAMTLTLQTYFTETINHLEKQGVRGFEDDICAYRDADGNACAVGYWIPDGHPALEKYAEDSGFGTRGKHNNLTVHELVEFFPDLRDIIAPPGEEGLGLAADLQSLHDRADNWDDDGFVGWDEVDRIVDSHGLVR
jgi:hypothetical protein